MSWVCSWSWWNLLTTSQKPSLNQPKRSKRSCHVTCIPYPSPGLGVDITIFLISTPFCDVKGFGIFPTGYRLGQTSLDMWNTTRVQVRTMDVLWDTCPNNEALIEGIVTVLPDVRTGMRSITPLPFSPAEQTIHTGIQSASLGPSSGGTQTIVTWYAVIIKYYSYIRFSWSVQLCVCVRACVSACMCACGCGWVCMCVCVYVCVHARVCARAWVGGCGCMGGWVCLWVSAQGLSAIVLV